MASRKDYEKVAEAIRVEVVQWPEKGTHWHIAYAIASELAQVFAQDNPRFNRSLFMVACGFPLELQS